MAKQGRGGCRVLWVSLEPFLLSILACPEDKGPLYYMEDESALYNPRLARRYRIEDDIPVLLIEEAQTVDQEEHSRVMAKIEADGLPPTFDPDAAIPDVPSS